MYNARGSRCIWCTSVVRFEPNHTHTHTYISGLIRKRASCSSSNCVSGWLSRFLFENRVGIKLKRPLIITPFFSASPEISTYIEHVEHRIPVYAEIVYFHLASRCVSPPYVGTATLTVMDGLTVIMADLDILYPICFGSINHSFSVLFLLYTCTVFIVFAFSR